MVAEQRCDATDRLPQGKIPPLAQPLQADLSDFALIDHAGLNLAVEQAGLGSHLFRVRPLDSACVVPLVA